jgi:hypothetical protein
MPTVGFSVNSGNRLLPDVRQGHIPVENMTPKTIPKTNPTRKYRTVISAPSFPQLLNQKTTPFQEETNLPSSS